MSSTYDDAHPERFIMRVQEDGTLRIEFGHVFQPEDIPVMTEATRVLEQLVPTQRHGQGHLG